jgi:hypothetical protein
MLMLFPAILCAQEFEFRLEPEAFPVEIDGWQPYAPWSGGMTEANPAVVDIDSDCDLDFFVGEYFGCIKFFRNEGSTTIPAFNFASAQFDSIAIIDESRNNPCFRDVDADGDLDIVLSDDESNVFFYRNIGTPQEPSYTLEDSSLVPVPPWCIGPELVDIDGDGDYDLFGGNYGQISLFQNDGTPLEFNFNLITGAFEGVDVGDKASPEFVDIDADGDEDLFIGNEEGRIWYYRNDPDSSGYNFTYVTDYFDSIDVGDIASPEFADIDGDGDYDLFVGQEDSPGDIYFYENVGSPYVPQFNLITRNYLSLDVGSVTPLAMTDIDADLDQDLFLRFSGCLSFYENTGSAISAYYCHVTDNYQNISVNDIYPFFCDIDADYDPDLFCGEGAIPGPPGLYLFSNQGTPQHALFILYSNNLVPGNFFVIIAPSLADIDGDDDYDLFISDQWNGDYFFYENIGTPSQPDFIYRTTNWQGISTGVQTQSCFYDIDQDGDLDLFMIPWNDWNQVWFYENVGTAQNAQMVLETQTFLSLEGINIFFGINIIDIDQDGDGDFFLSTDNGGCMFFRNVTGEPAVRPKVVSPYRGPVLTLGPNPANPVTWVTFNLPTPQKATLAVYNLLGRRVSILTQGLQPAGINTYLWNTSQVASGVYIMRLETPKYTSSQRIIIVK